MGRQLLRSSLTLGVVAALGAAVLAFSAPGVATDDALVAVGSTDNNANSSCNGKNNTSCQPVTDGPVKDFGLTIGPMSGIYPTGSKPIPLTFSNPHNFDIVVTTLKVEATDASLDCPAEHLLHPGSVTLLTPVVVPKNGTVTGPTPSSADGQVLRVTLLNSVPDDCQAPTTWPITVTATAVKR